MTLTRTVAGGGAPGRPMTTRSATRRLEPLAVDAHFGRLALDRRDDAFQPRRDADADARLERDGRRRLRRQQRAGVARVAAVADTAGDGVERGPRIGAQVAGLAGREAARIV